MARKNIIFKWLSQSKQEKNFYKHLMSSAIPNSIKIQFEMSINYGNWQRYSSILIDVKELFLATRSLNTVIRFQVILNARKKKKNTTNHHCTGIDESKKNGWERERSNKFKCWIAHHKITIEFNSVQKWCIKHKIKIVNQILLFRYFVFISFKLVNKICMC